MTNPEKKHLIGVYARMDRVHSINEITSKELDPMQSIRNAVIKVLPDIAPSACTITKQFGENGRDDVYAVEVRSARDDVRIELAKALPMGFELASLDFEPDKLVDVEIEIRFQHYHQYGDDLETLTESLFQHMRRTVRRDTEIPEFTASVTSNADAETGVSDFKVVFHQVAAKSANKFAHNVQSAIPNIRQTVGVILTNETED